MRDLAWMLAVLVAGGFHTLMATVHGGLLCGAVVAGVAGWAMAQHDEHYKRVRNSRTPPG